MWLYLLTDVHLLFSWKVGGSIIQEAGFLALCWHLMRTRIYLVEGLSISFTICFMAFYISWEPVRVHTCSYLGVINIKGKESTLMACKSFDIFLKTFGWLLSQTVIKMQELWRNRLHSLWPIYICILQWTEN